MRRGDPDDPERALAPRVVDTLGPLFDAPPERQSTTDKTAIRYATWRLTPDGKAVYDWIDRRARDRAESGERRIGTKSLVERARDELHLHIDNKFTSMIARELVLRHPHLRERIELRERTAA
jgi:hypothetical protein